MMIPFTCQCGVKLKALETFAGRQTTCPRCGQGVQIPDLPANSVSTLPPGSYENPTPEQLGGGYLYIEAEEDLTVRPWQPPRKAAGPAWNGQGCPTPECLG